MYLTKSFFTLLILLMLLLILGPTVACAQEGIDDFGSYEKMEDNGWDLKAIDKKNRLVLQDETCWKNLERIHEFNWAVQRWSAQNISTTFWGHGRASLRFGNCNNVSSVFGFPKVSSKHVK